MIETIDNVNIPDIENYLSMLRELRLRNKSRPEGWAYDGMEDFVLKEGTRFTQRDYDIPNMPKKRCFNNSFEVAIREEGLYYCEGWAMGVIPIHHAWLCDSDGVVYDHTWWGDRTSVDNYIGVAFDLEFVMDQANKHDRAGLFFPDGHHINIDIMEGRAKLVKLNV